MRISLDEGEERKVAMTIGELIKKYRTEHNLGLRKFATLCGLSPGYISMLENENNPSSKRPPAPSMETIKAVARAMDKGVVAVMKDIGLDVRTEDLDKEDLPTVSVSSNFVIPFKHIPLTQENLAAAVSERRLILLPFPLPVVGTNVYVPNKDYGMAVLYTVNHASGGCFVASSELGSIQFNLFDIGLKVFLSRREARESTEKHRAHFKYSEPEQTEG